jgi:hypothetical protein
LAKAGSTPYPERDYENKSNWTLGENEPKTNPKQTQSNPIQVEAEPAPTGLLGGADPYGQASRNPQTGDPIQTQSNPISQELLENTAALCYHKKKKGDGDEKSKPALNHWFYRPAVSGLNIRAACQL